jgi:hypothetical protein
VARPPHRAAHQAGVFVQAQPARVGGISSLTSAVGNSNDWSQELAGSVQLRHGA